MILNTILINGGEYESSIEENWHYNTLVRGDFTPFLNSWLNGIEMCGHCIQSIGVFTIRWAILLKRKKTTISIYHFFHWTGMEHKKQTIWYLPWVVHDMYQHIPLSMERSQQQNYIHMIWLQVVCATAHLYMVFLL